MSASFKQYSTWMDSVMKGNTVDDGMSVETEFSMGN